MPSWSCSNSKCKYASKSYLKLFWKIDNKYAANFAIELTQSSKFYTTHLSPTTTTQSMGFSKFILKQYHKSITTNSSFSPLIFACIITASIISELILTYSILVKSKFLLRLIKFYYAKSKLVRTTKKCCNLKLVRYKIRVQILRGNDLRKGPGLIETRTLKI